ncbi:hypothetical protein GCM10023115_45530 [Pontixanthobacter gangjinensis]|uniref:Uncharacterized protein n=1 Tax=Christiangramia aestuarii TaxID=1028746 RepID=A0A7M3SXM2_9FLAO|nr:hypothetical protein [Christiangramia aestuarii]MUP41353.1 hypothetical protein [Christiangramia aestuarii]
MKLRIPRTNLEKQLLKIRDKKTSEQQLLEQVEKILAEAGKKDEEIFKELEAGQGIDRNDFNFDLLETHRIFHLDDIYQICIDYRLRFLDSKFFKAKIPYEAVMEVNRLEKAHETTLRGFKIVAPSKLFKLENADDPLLFAPIGNDYYYLIHKWGNDLHPFRKMIMWPFKTLENFVVLLLAISFLTALLIPDGLFSQQQSTTEFFMVFFFIFKWFAGLSIFYGFKMGKNFNTAIWDSKFYNA